MFRWSSSALNPEPASENVHVEESGTISLNNLVWPVDQASIIYQHQLSSLCSNAAVIIYYHMSIPSGIDFDHFSAFLKIMEIEKKFHCSRGLNLWHCSWDFNLGLIGTLAISATTAGLQGNCIFTFLGYLPIYSKSFEQYRRSIDRVAFST